MIIDNFYVGAMSIAPAKADTPLIVYTDAMLTRAFALQPFQAIRRWNAQIIKALRGVKHPQLPTRKSLNLVGRRRETSPCQMRSVSLSAKLRITFRL